MFWIFPIYDLTDGKQTAAPRRNFSCRGLAVRQHIQQHAPPRLLQLLSLSLPRTANHTGSAIPMWLFAEAVSLSVISQVPLSTGSVLLVLFIIIVIYLFFFNVLPPRWTLLHSILPLPVLVFAPFKPLRHILHAVCDHQLPGFYSSAQFPKGQRKFNGDRKGLILNLCPQICQQSLRPLSEGWRISVKLGADVWMVLWRQWPHLYPR